MGWPFLAAAKSAASLGAALAAAKGGFMGLRGRFKATRGAKAVAMRRRVRRVAPRPLPAFRNVFYNPIPFPRSKDYNLTFAYTGNLSTGTTQLVYGDEQVWRLNALFQPNVGAETLQPLYFDQLTALYQRYRVDAVKIEIQWFTSEATHTVACAFKVANSDDAVTITGKTSRYIDAMPLTDAIVIAPAGEHEYKQHLPMHTMRELEGEKFFTQGDSYSAQVTANPTNSPLLRLAVAPMSSTSSSTVQYRLWITYKTHFYELKVPSEST